ncbi:TetR/AcrR family transcriptional regulator [Ralstonia soli]|uniref:TetR/AcrR family transcriptional regulator n=1 Tax=Ralstonia soli TaxID=2953896 RepID=A0ABT1AT73_9RALS|nr:TetR/AcrR family transcriptional regulator [Ralstonia soli]MCO5401595.1 TetR/AcrR family transcriptional regulator [Ralstonia soli]
MNPMNSVLARQHGGIGHRSSPVNEGEFRRRHGRSLPGNADADLGQLGSMSQTKQYVTHIGTNSTFVPIVGQSLTEEFDQQITARSTARESRKGMDRQLRWGDSSRMDSITDGQRAILRAALDAMVEHGIDGLSIDDVARRANISRRTLYRYFGTKKELIQKVISVENAAFFEEMQHSLAGFAHDFEAYCEECVCFAVRYRDRHHGGFHHNYLATSVSTEVFGYIVEDIAPMWRRVLEKPYRQYVAVRGPQVPALDDLIALISRIGLAYCLTPVEEPAMRTQMRILWSFHRDPNGK